MEQLDLALYSEKRPQVAKVRYSHDAMIDLVIQNPGIAQNEIAAAFGYTPSWVSTIFASDAFQARMAMRREEVIVPAVRATIEERFKALVIQSLEVLRRKLEVQPSDELALGAATIAAKALGYGARPAAVQVNQQFVVHVPAKSESSEIWEAEHAAPGRSPGADSANVLTVEETA